MRKFESQARTLYKRWRDGAGGRWRYQITWYQGAEVDNTRLVIEDKEIGNRNIWPLSKEATEMVWDAFRRAPAATFLHYWYK
jgi:hypothetical protein